MVARLESDIERSSPSILTRVLKGDQLRVRPARPLVKSFADDSIVTNDDRSHHRIRYRLTTPALGERKRTVHPAVVGISLRRGRRYRLPIALRRLPTPSRPLHARSARP